MATGTSVEGEAFLILAPRRSGFGQVLERLAGLPSRAADHRGQVGRRKLTGAAKNELRELHPRLLLRRQAGELHLVTAREEIDDNCSPTLGTLLCAGCGQDKPPLEPVDGRGDKLALVADQTGQVGSTTRPLVVQ
jgi:hypothetical protein